MSSHNLHTDPVCGMQVEEAETDETAEYQGRTYYFCSRACRLEFETNPEPYAGTPNANAPSGNRR